MIKLLYKPTGNIFTLPDAEALRIKKEDRGNDYVLLDAGLQEEEVKTITKQEVKDIEAEKAKKIEESNKADEEAEAKAKAAEMPKKKSDFFKKYDVSDLTKLPKKDLVLLAEKLGMRDMENKTMEEIIAYIEGDKKKVLKKPGSGRTRKA